MDSETIRILQQDAAFRAQFTPIQELRREHGLDQDEAELVVTMAEEINREMNREILEDLRSEIEILEDLRSEIDREILEDIRSFTGKPNWKIEGF